jgi:hypothetical protein
MGYDITGTRDPTQTNVAPRTNVHTDYRLDNLLFPASFGADTPIAVVDPQSACGTGIDGPFSVADVFQTVIPYLGLLRVRRMPPRLPGPGRGVGPW